MFSSKLISFFQVPFMILSTWPDISPILTATLVPYHPLPSFHAFSLLAAFLPFFFFSSSAAALCYIIYCLNYTLKKFFFRARRKCVCICIWVGKKGINYLHKNNFKHKSLSSSEGFFSNDVGSSVWRYISWWMLRELKVTKLPYHPLWKILVVL